MQVFITGVSRGLGLALAEEFLGQGHFVTGIGRSTKTQADKYRFISCDLASHAEVEALELEIQPGLEVLLINNAGIIRPVQRISDQERDFSAEIFQVNTLLPSS
jgi:NAD(P)-dependent dehydrogenase (short-subunit alcohol dehydrogenase family)